MGTLSHDTQHPNRKTIEKNRVKKQNTKEYARWEETNRINRQKGEDKRGPKQGIGESKELTWLLLRVS
jgi:hypothetical protein